jgi:hypothetical protein
MEEEYQFEFLRDEKPNNLRFKYLRDPDCLTHVELALMVDSGLYYAKNTIGYIQNCMLVHVARLIFRFESEEDDLSPAHLPPISPPHPVLGHAPFNSPASFDCCS